MQQNNQGDSPLKDVTIVPIEILEKARFQGRFGIFLALLGLGVGFWAVFDAGRQRGQAIARDQYLAELSQVRQEYVDNTSLFIKAWEHQEQSVEFIETFALYIAQVEQVREFNDKNKPIDRPNWRKWTRQTTQRQVYSVP